MIITDSKRRIPAYLTAVLIAAVAVTIFMFSAQPADESSETSAPFVQALIRIFAPDDESLDPQQRENLELMLTRFVRKGAHFTIYAILSAVSLLHVLFAAGKLQLKIPVGFAALYACTDEFHQLFVQGRAGRITDVLLDSCGALTGALLLMPVIRFAVKKSK